MRVLSGEELQEFLRGMIDCRLSRAVMAYGEELHLHLSKPGESSGKPAWRLGSMASEWMLLDGERVLACSDDQTGADAFEPLLGRPIQRVEFSASDHALTLIFGNGPCLSILPEVEEDEEDPLPHWELFTAEDRLLRLTAQGQAELCDATQPA